MGWLRRLSHEWSKNDGKPREQWESGRSLREDVLVGLIAVLLLAQTVIVIWMLFGR